MMIPEYAKTGCIKLLLTLAPEDVSAIKDTVTNRMIATLSVRESIEVILTYSTSPEELLSRKKVKRETLFRYLHDQHVADVSSANSKSELVLKVISFWKSNESQTGGDEIKRQETTSIVSDTGQKLAQEFIQWFYPMLNGLAAPHSSAAKWGPENFWPDASLNLVLISEHSERREERYIGAEAAQERLASIVQKDQAILNANCMPEGYRGIISAHGLAKVAACGTLHRIPQNCIGLQGDMLGIFEQSFGLIRDPMDGNRWKIKISELKLRFSNLSQPIGYQPSISLSDDIVRSICSD